MTEEQLKELEEIQNKFKIVMDEIEKEQEEYWESLSHDEQLKAFCAVVRRIHKGEIEDNGSYRWVLYDVFGFGPESYAQAQLAGFLDIHNAIYPRDYDNTLLSSFCEKYNIEDSETKIKTFFNI